MHQVLSNSECRSCFKTISELLPGCFPYTGGRAYSDGCFIRAENYSFYHEIIGPDDLKRCGDNKVKDEKFSSMAKHLINQMASKAPDHDGFISMHEESPSGLAVHGLATCWMMLEPDICSACLSDAAGTALSCLPSIEGCVHNAGCFLRYADYYFSSEARAREARDTLLKYVFYGLAAITACSLGIIIGYCVGTSTYKLSCLARNRKELEINLSILKRSFPFVPFNYSTLAKATEDFNESFKLGEGGFGTIYKRILPDGREIAIKRLFISQKIRTQDIYNEMDVISRVQHKNLVRFIGYCFTSADSFLVYEFLANKSLDYILFDPEQKKQLDWPKRLGIIIGTAEGLEYLHKNCREQIIHRDIKASNILLDLKYKPKIADFGLARFMSCDKTNVSTAIEGTLGYMAPEYLAEGRITEKVDIFSFGVLVLEIVSGVQNSKFQPAETFETLVGHAWKHFQRNAAAEIIDESMESKDVDEILRFIHVGL